MRRASRAIVVALVLTLAATASLWAERIDEEALIEKWTEQRDAAVVKLISKWLQGASRDDLDRMLLKIVRFEGLLGTTSRDAEDLYLSKLDPKDTRDVPAQILDVYLARKAIKIDTAGFFEGKSFTVTKKMRQIPEQTPRGGRAGASTETPLSRTNRRRVRDYGRTEN